MEIHMQLTSQKKEKPDLNQSLPFGHYFTDHMFMMDYDTNKGWHNARIVPFQNISLSPAANILHYGQEVFEGLKAYRQENGDIVLFRPEMNAKRAKQSNQRLCIPPLDEEWFIEGIKALVNVDQDWIPSQENANLYIRPFFIATDAHLGVKVSNHYLFIIILSPSGPYYPSGLSPVKIMVEDHYVRAVQGGTGAAKTSGNYAASLIGQDLAYQEGYDQVLWLDGLHHRYIEEVGAMNIFFKINGTIITPKIDGSILEGITRDSIIALCHYWKIPCEEREITIDEVIEAYHKGELEEVFGSGTAAVISPVGVLKYHDLIMNINEGKIGLFASKLYATITGIQKGLLPDELHWIEKV